MVYLARAYDTGKGLGTRTVCWEEALYWYTQSVEAVEASDEEGNYDGTMDDPTYQLLGRMAEMYRDGGHGVERDPSKAGKHFCTIALEGTSILMFCNGFLPADYFTNAADAAMAAMKGRLANKYYALAEEMNALVDGDE